MDKFYCVSVSFARLGGGEQIDNYYYNTRINAEEHIDKFRHETNLHRNDYQIVTDKGDYLLLRDDNRKEVSLRLTECYFED